MELATLILVSINAAISIVGMIGFIAALLSENYNK
jgi:preprotein translocase subunit Sss1